MAKAAAASASKPQNTNCKKLDAPASLRFDTANPVRRLAVLWMDILGLIWLT